MARWTGSTTSRCCGRSSTIRSSSTCPRRVITWPMKSPGIAASTWTGWANAWAIERAAPVPLRSGVQRVAHRLLGGAIEGLAGGGFGPFREAGQLVVAQLPIDVRQGIGQVAAHLRSHALTTTAAVLPPHLHPSPQHFPASL